MRQSLLNFLASAALSLGLAGPVVAQEAISAANVAITANLRYLGALDRVSTMAALLEDDGGTAPAAPRPHGCVSLRHTRLASIKKRGRGPVSRGEARDQLTVTRTATALETAVCSSLTV